MKKTILIFVSLLLCVLWGVGASAEEGPMPRVLYTGIAQTNISIRKEPSTEAESLGVIREGEKAQIIAYAPNWLEVVRGTEEGWVRGYVLRHTIWDIAAVVDGVLPYGAEPAAYSAILSKDAPLYAVPGPSREDVPIFQLTEGTKVAILSMEDGWARVQYQRSYAYFYVDAIAEMTPVYDLETAQSGDMIAAFISFYSISEAGLNPNRMLNISIACDMISIVMEPGDGFAFNTVAGPYSPKFGYKEAPSFVAGQTVPSYGGGTCQVSSTLYNVLLPIQEGMNVLYRRAHGPSGAAYLPHGVDAAVGNETLDLRFRNDFDFPVRIEASAKDGVLYIAMLKA